MKKVEYGQGEKVTLACLVGNILLSIFKGIAGYLGGSKAMIADAFHSASDVLATIVVYFSIKIAGRPVDKGHPYGHGKIEPLAAAFVGITLVIAAYFIVKGIIESIVAQSFNAPSIIALIAAVVSIVVKEIMYRETYKVGQKLNSDSIKANAWDHRSDAYSSIGTFFGILGSIAGKHLGIDFLKYLDPVAGILVASLIFKIAFEILGGAIKGLMDAHPGDDKLEDIWKVVESVEGVVSIDWIRARYIGSHLMVDMAIVVDAKKSVHEGHVIADAVRDRVLEKVNNTGEVLVHVNPASDNNDADRGM